MAKWMAAFRKRMEKKGTKGALRATAKRKGLISGTESLTCADVATLKRSKDPKIVARATAAGNMMKCK